MNEMLSMQPSPEPVRPNQSFDPSPGEPQPRGRPSGSGGGRAWMRRLGPMGCIIVILVAILIGVAGIFVVRWVLPQAELDDAKVQSGQTQSIPSRSDTGTAAPETRLGETALRSVNENLKGNQPVEGVTSFVLEGGSILPALEKNPAQ